MYRTAYGTARLRRTAFVAVLASWALTSCHVQEEPDAPSDDAVEDNGGSGGDEKAEGGRGGTGQDNPKQELPSSPDAAAADALEPPFGDCPTAAPFDDRHPRVVTECTQSVLIAVGNGMRRIVSLDDGATWIHEHSAPFPNGGDENENSFTGVAIGRGLIITTGDGGVHVSRDAGATWQLVPEFGKRQHASAIEYGDGRFLLTRWTGGGAFSEDGVRWTEVKIPGNGHAHGAAFGNGKWASIYNGTSVAFSGDNGKTWKLTSIAPAFTGGWLEAIVFGGDRFVVVGQLDGRRAMTMDGTAWLGVANNKTPGALQAQFEDLTWDGKEFLTSGTAAASSDGVTWETVKSDTKLEFITYGDGIYLGALGNTLHTSRDGRAWKQAWKGGIAAPFIELAVGRVLHSATKTTQ